MVSENLNIESIYKEYYPKIHRYMVKMIGVSHAEDLTQDVFVKVNRSLDDFRHASKLSTWIYRIATNTALDRIRYKSTVKNLAPLQTENESDEFVNEPEDQDTWTNERKLSTEEKIVKDEMNECIRGIIDELPRDFKIVILLSEMEGFKDREISEILGVSMNTVKIRLHRARCMLKCKMEEKCNFYRNENNDLSCDRK